MGNDPSYKGRPACRHRYQGSHGKGWTCVDCGDFQEEVPYYLTVDCERKRSALERAKSDLKRSIDMHFLEGVRAGLLEAIELVKMSGKGDAVETDTIRAIESRIEALRV